MENLWWELLTKPKRANVRQWLRMIKSLYHFHLQMMRGCSNIHWCIVFHCAVLVWGCIDRLGLSLINIPSFAFVFANRAIMFLFSTLKTLCTLCRALTSWMCRLCYTTEAGFSLGAFLIVWSTSFLLLFLLFRPGSLPFMELMDY